MTEEKEQELWDALWRHTEVLEKLQNELEAAKNDIAALLWLNGDCEYCRFGQRDEYHGASRWSCKLGGVADCRPEWRGQGKTD